MKTAVWSLVVILGLLLVLIVGSSAMVYAKQGIDGLEAYSLALQAVVAVVAVAQSAFQTMGSIVTSAGNTIVALFNSATAP